MRKVCQVTSAHAAALHAPLMARRPTWDDIKPNHFRVPLLGTATTLGGVFDPRRYERDLRAALPDRIIVVPPTTHDGCPCVLVERADADRIAPLPRATSTRPRAASRAPSIPPTGDRARAPSLPPRPQAQGRGRALTPAPALASPDEGEAAQQQQHMQAQVRGSTAALIVCLALALLVLLLSD